MFAIFESILPIFLLIVAGNLLRRAPIIDDTAWPGLEQICYWFLYPVLLFTTILNADFSDLQLDRMMAALIVAVALMGLGTIALWPFLKRGKLVSPREFSSIFQTSVRWNGFMALAVAEKLFAPEGMAVVALVMAVMIIPINIESVVVVTRFADSSAKWPRIARTIATNPLILATLAALVARFSLGSLYPPFNLALDLVGRAALGMGLLAIGAGLRPADMASARFAIWLPVLLKLGLFPMLLIALALLFGVQGDELLYLALCGAVPTAMNGYLLARQLGGDAELYAAVTTLQTAVSFLTIPAVLTAVGYITSG
ncbi:AEC family transporter [Mesorhizobium xinjiangense]|uniref:AEC family transporter n=1 Tax=Mesorhizobium xinjiangense TaxID=2678685 RepID=UPI0012EE4716|nr:AEC family transporter [Mesorhizobium xinjiangense]